MAAAAGIPTLGPLVPAEPSTMRRGAKTATLSELRKVMKNWLAHRATIIVQPER